MKFKFLVKTLLPLVTLAIFTIAVTGETPREAAIKFISIQSKRMIKEWQGTEVGESTIYYDLEGNPAAYCFSIFEKDRDLGYLILEEGRDNPVQEFSISLPPHRRNLPGQYQEKIQARLPSPLKLGPARFLYPCPGVYLVEFPLSEDNQPAGATYLDLRSLLVVKPFPISQKFPSFPQSRNPHFSFRYLEDVPIYQFFRSTHPLAAAEVLEYRGLRREGEPIKAFIAGLASFLEECLCDLPEKPSIWQVEKGVEGFSAYRQNKLEVIEKCKYSEVTEERITFDDYKRAIDAEQPVIVTFLYDPEYRRGLGIASQRMSGVSVAGVGYLSDETGNYIIGHDGLFLGEEPLSRKGKEPWARPGVTFYNWDGNYSNIILAFVNRPGRKLPFKISFGASAYAQEPTIQLLYFYSPTCKECIQLKEFLVKLGKKYPQLEVKEYDLSVTENIGLMNEYYNSFKVPYEEWGGTLALFIGDRCFTDYREIKKTEKGLEEEIKKYLKTGSIIPEPRKERNLIQVFRSFGLLTILAAGLIDGVNPCAFATIVFLIAYLTMIVKRRRKEILFTGISFTLGIFLAYLLIGLGLLKALQVLKGITLVSKLLYPAIGGLVFILAIYNFKDYLAIKRGKFGEITLQLPRFLKLGIHKVIREQTRIKYFVILAFITGIIISILELFCTGQVYLPTIMYILGIPGLKVKALFYLILYALMFIVPLAVIFLLVYFGMTSKGLETFGRRHASTVKFLMALLFLFFAVFMFTVTAQLFGWL